MIGSLDWLVFRLVVKFKSIYLNNGQFAKNSLLKTRDAGSQYRCGWVGRSIKPPLYTLRPPSNTQSKTASVFFTFPLMRCRRTDGPTNWPVDRKSLSLSCVSAATTRIKKKAAPFCNWVEEAQKINLNFFGSTDFKDFWIFFHSRPTPGLYLKPFRR